MLLNNKALTPGKFYKAKDGSVWCCFRVWSTDSEYAQADCVQIRTSQIECFFLDGRYDREGLHKLNLIQEVPYEA